jgi:signal transduction histidine kinase
VNYPNYPNFKVSRNVKISRLRDQFLDAASHEFKTPLTSLRLQVQMISRMAGEERVKRLAGDADKQIERMTHLINDLLDATGIRMGQLELRSDEIDLAEMVKEEVALFLSDPAFADIRIRVHAPQPIYGVWDRSRIAQIFKSLLSNAARYGLRKPVDVTVWGDRTQGRISVRDQGIGISEEDQVRIFHQFERCVEYQKFGGFGLGLYVSRQIALAHGGQIEVKSREGEGSVFTLQLPLPQKAAASVKAARAG